ncbi:MAG TPA: PAS domain S-box protein [Balneolaceae bacterium]|nr:PAS domain S-box protein [Balneolaceae bacterium]
MQALDPEMLRKLSKDEKSYKKIREIVENLREEVQQNSDRLDLLESAIRSDYDSILITELNLNKPGPRIVYVNDGFCKMTGYSKEEVIGKTPRILQGPKTDRKVLDKLKKRLSEGQSFFGQAVNYRKDGSEFINQWDIHPLTDSEGEITHWVSYQHDITKRKRAEEQLLDTKVEFDGLREASQRTVIDVDVQGNIVMANKAFRELIGYGKDELKRIKVWDLFPERYMNSLKGRFDKQDEDAYFNGEEFKGIIKHKSGIPIQVKGETQILDLKDQKLIRAVIENISLQKRIMETLKKRNFDYGRIVDTASEFEYEVAFDGDKIVINAVSESFAPLTGLSEEAVTGKDSLAAFIHKDDIDSVKAHLLKVKKGKDSTCEYRLKCKDGNYIQVMDYARPEWDETHKKVQMVHGAVSFDEAYEESPEA